MSWRTPCTFDPDLWTSKHPDERLTAFEACQGCHRLKACAQEAVENPDERIGVRGGIDWTVSKHTGLSMGPVQCLNARCGRLIAQNQTGGRRSFCNDKCRSMARAEAA